MAFLPSRSGIDAMPPQHGDDLQDDFLPDPLVADSGGEDQSDLDDSPASHLSGPQPSLGDVAKARKRKRREKEKERKKVCSQKLTN